MVEPHNEGDYILRTEVQETMDGEKKRRRLRMMLLEWMMTVDYSKLKERA